MKVRVRVRVMMRVRVRVRLRMRVRVNMLLLHIFDNIYTTNDEIHLHNTRQSSKLHINTIKNNFGKDTLKYIGTTNWNHLPKSIIQNKTIKCFGKKVKQYLISSY